MAAIVMEQVQHISVRWHGFAERERMGHPVMDLFLTIILCPVAAIGGITAVVSSVMLPIAYLMGWL